LRFVATRAIHVVTAVITAKGENMIANTEQTETAPVSVAAEPKATKTARAAKRGAHVAPKKGKSGKKATPAKKAPKAPKGEKKGGAARDGSKAAKMLELLKRPGGVTSKELMKATGWQPHSVRGFLSGTIGKKMGLTVTSTKSEDGERNYSIKA
jgi:Protein of unknown function (DUF3489)